MAQPPQRRPGAGSSGSHDRRALLEAYQEVLRTTSEKPAPVPPPPPSRTPLRLGLGLIALSLLGVLLLQPRWLFPRPAPEPPALQEASLRVRMYLEIEKIQQFQSTNGRLPETLAAIGGDSTGVQYRPEGTRFSLTGVNGKLTLVYQSETPPETFLGNSYALIRARGHQ